MTAIPAAAGHGHMAPAKRQKVNLVGLWLFFFSESIVFGLLLSARFYLLGLETDHVDQALGLAITVILLLSSVTAFTAETAMEHGNRALCGWMLLCTILLGIIFAGGVGYEWSTAHFHRQEAFGTVFFTMTGIHAAHVVSGIVMLLMTYSMVMRGHFSNKSHFGVSGVIMYWHFVDVVWVFFYPALYLFQ